MPSHYDRSGPDRSPFPGETRGRRAPAQSKRALAKRAAVVPKRAKPNPTLSIMEKELKQMNAVMARARAQNDRNRFKAEGRPLPTAGEMEAARRAYLTARSLGPGQQPPSPPSLRSAPMPQPTKRVGALRATPIPQPKKRAGALPSATMPQPKKRVPARRAAPKRARKR